MPPRRRQRAIKFVSQSYVHPLLDRGSLPPPMIMVTWPVTSYCDYVVHRRQAMLRIADAASGLGCLPAGGPFDYSRLDSDNSLTPPPCPHPPLTPTMFTTRTNPPNPPPPTHPNQSNQKNQTHQSSDNDLSTARQNPCHRQPTRPIRPPFHHHNLPLALLKRTEVIGNERLFPKSPPSGRRPASEWRPWPFQSTT